MGDGRRAVRALEDNVGDVTRAHERAIERLLADPAPMPTTTAHRSPVVRAFEELIASFG
jgi:hypothetical protein